MKYHLVGLITVFLAASAQAAQVGDSAAGKLIHDTSCVSCHDTRVYTRKDRHIQSLDGLKQQLDNCGHAAKVVLSEADKQNLAKYLDDQFYKFSK